jgi:uncharacterized protein (TIGR03032 family)
LSDRDSFTPLWRPPFLSQLAPEDRCHLNCLALEEGHARYVTAVRASDVADGWHDRRRDGEGETCPRFKTSTRIPRMSCNHIR